MFNLFKKQPTNPNTAWYAWKVEYERLTGRLLEGKEFGAVYQVYMGGLTPLEAHEHLTMCNFYDTQE